MELKPGTYYRTRDGRKAYVSCIVEPSPFGGANSFFPANGYVEGMSLLTAWRSDGLSALGGSSSADLIEEWREPRTASCKRKFVLVECDNNPVQVRPEGNECSMCRIIGRKTVEVSITEGDEL